jgi:hypothetical protein
MNSTNAEIDIAGFLARYTPEIEAQLRGARAKLRRLFPRGFELVYDNYNALVFAICASARASDAIISIAGYPKWITLFLLRGTSLADPKGILEGEGNQVRSIRLADPKDLDKPEIKALIALAARPHKAELLAGPSLTTIVKSVSAKQRPRRPTSAVAAPATKPRRTRK